MRRASGQRTPPPCSRLRWGVKAVQSSRGTKPLIMGVGLVPVLGSQPPATDLT